MYIFTEFHILYNNILCIHSLPLEPQHKQIIRHHMTENEYIIDGDSPFHTLYLGSFQSKQNFSFKSHGTTQR